METFADAVADTAATSTEAALSIFDRLDPIEVEAMFGPWKGSGFPTHHPLDGALEAYTGTASGLAVVLYVAARVGGFGF